MVMSGGNDDFFLHQAFIGFELECNCLQGSLYSQSVQCLKVIYPTGTIHVALGIMLYIVQSPTEFKNKVKNALNKIALECDPCHASRCSP